MCLNKHVLFLFFKRKNGKDCNLLHSNKYDYATLLDKNNYFNKFNL